MKISPPYFKADDLAKRWGISKDEVLSFGAAGELQFGVFMNGVLPIEICERSGPPAYESVVIDKGVWSGFVPVRPEMVAEIWIQGKTTCLQIPDTNCGRQVIPGDYIPSSECDEGPMLIVDRQEVERFEQSAEPSTRGSAEPIETTAPPIGWARGIRVVAWDAAQKIVGRGDKLSAAALEKKMLDSGKVEFHSGSDEFRLKESSDELDDREYKAKPKTIAGWVTALKKLL